MSGSIMLGFGEDVILGSNDKIDFVLGSAVFGI